MTPRSAARASGSQSTRASGAPVRPGGTEHLDFGRCKLHGGATPYKSGRYSKVVREFYWPSIKWKLRAYNYQQIRMRLGVLIPDPERREELLRMLLRETGLCDDDVEQGQAS
jgi:hypothetical protein